MSWYIGIDFFPFLAIDRELNRPIGNIGWTPYFIFDRQWIFTIQNENNFGHYLSPLQVRKIKRNVSQTAICPRPKDETLKHNNMHTKELTANSRRLDY